MRIFLVLMMLLMGACTAKTKETKETKVAELETSQAALNDSHVLYDGPDRKEVLERLSRAIDQYEKMPRQDGGAPHFGSLAQHSQEHIIKIAWEDREQKAMRINTYPSVRPMWAVSFVVDANDAIVRVVTETSEPRPTE